MAILQEFRHTHNQILTVLVIVGLCFLLYLIWGGSCDGESDGGKIGEFWGTGDDDGNERDQVAGYENSNGDTQSGNDEGVVTELFLDG